MKITKYESYKESGIVWLGEIPEHWEIKKIKHIGKIKSGDAIVNNELKDIGKYEVFGGNGLMGYCNKYNVINENFIIGRVGAYCGNVRFSNEKRWISDNALIFSLFKKQSHAYALHLLNASRLNSLNSSNAQPLITGNKVLNFNIPYPPRDEQNAIASFLDTKTAQIDQAISQKEKMTELLKERRQIVINKAVTRGINPNASMKESGVEWIGEIPEHWEIRRAKYLFKEIDERSKTGKEELLSVSHMTGVTPRSEKNVSMFMSEDYTGSKTCKKDDLVMNIMWAWMGALGVSAHEGIVSSSYAIYRQINKELNSKYIEYLLKSPKYIEHYNRVSTGLHSSRLRFYSHMFMSMKIGFPSIDEQLQIVAYIEEHTSKIDAAIELQQNYIAKLKEYKATLIDSVVTGKVRVA